MTALADPSRVTEILNTRREQQLELLQQMVRIPSVSGQEEAITDFLAERLVELGFACELVPIDVDRVAEHQPNSRDQEFDTRRNLWARLEPTGQRPTLLLNGHLDTVPPGAASRWARDPYSGEIVDGGVWGRGSVDMKGGITAAIFAMLAAADLGAPVADSVALGLTVGEEIGGAGAVSMSGALEGIVGSVVMEPTELAIAPAHAGATQFRVTISGRSAHACVRDDGDSALTKAAGFLAEVQRFEDRRNAMSTHPLFADIANKVPCNIGTIAGGEWPSTVPELVVLEGRIGVLPGEDVADVRADFEQMLANWAANDAHQIAHPPRCEWVGMTFSPAETSDGAAIVGSLRRGFVSATGGEPKVEGMTYGSDMSHFVRLGGVPTVLFGPGSIRQAHAANECLSLAELETATTVLTHFLIDWGASGATDVCS